MRQSTALPVTGCACWNFAMLSGTELGQALARAITLKGVKQQQVADAFGVRQASVSEWIKTGRIAKRHIDMLLSYFHDVAGPDHWGIASGVTAPTMESSRREEAAEPAPLTGVVADCQNQLVAMTGGPLVRLTRWHRLLMHWVDLDSGSLIKA